MEDNKTQSLFTREITSEPINGGFVRCMGCMESFSEEFRVCPECGYIIGTAPKTPYCLKPGTLLRENYILGKVIGQGGFGITYIGWDISKKRKVAVKEFFPNALSTRTEGATAVSCYNDKAERYFREGVRKMMDEGARLSKFSGHPNIVNVYDSFEQNKTAYIVMEYLDGRSLKEYAAEKGGRLEPREAVNLMMPVIGALKDMHRENMIHRDIAPDNVYICNDGRIKLLDFGSARISVQDAEKSLSVMVKPGYAPKEQYASRSKQGPWTDVYSVCATIYKLVTGEAPVESIEREVTPLKTFDEFGIEGYDDIQDILFKGLEPDVSDRIASAEELETLLKENFLDENNEYNEEETYEEEEGDNLKYIEGIALVCVVSVLLVVLFVAIYR